MVFEQYSKYDGLGLADLVRRKEVSPRELVDSALDAIERVNPEVNCVVQTLRKEAMAEILRGKVSVEVEAKVCESWEEK